MHCLLSQFEHLEMRFEFEIINKLVATILLLLLLANFVYVFFLIRYSELEPILFIDFWYLISESK